MGGMFMKKLGLSLVTVAVLSISHTAAASSMLNEDKLVRLCEAVKSNNQLTLMTEMKRNHLKYSHLVDGLVCDGVDVATFAKQNGADRTANLLISRNRSTSDMLVRTE